MTDAPLSAVFRQRALRSKAFAAGAAWPSEQELEALLAASLRAWPGVEVPAPEFVGYLAERLGPGDDPRAGLQALQTADLYLACGCVLGLPRALRAFEESLLCSVPAYVARLDSSPSFADDVCQALREKLFVSRGDGAAPKIAGYSGRGNLGGWLRVAAINTGLALRKPPGPAAPSADEVGRDLPAQGASPELDYLRVRHRADVEDAFRLAFAELPDKDRNIFRLHYGEGLQLAEIARSYGVNPSTVSRWLSRAQEAVIARTNTILLDKLGLTQSELTSLMDDVKSQLHLSLQGILPRK